jgi:hypothetical protein
MKWLKRYQSDTQGGAEQDLEWETEQAIRMPGMKNVLQFVTWFTRPCKTVRP